MQVKRIQRYPCAIIKLQFMENKARSSAGSIWCRSLKLRGCKGKYTILISVRFRGQGLNFRDTIKGFPEVILGENQLLKGNGSCWLTMTKPVMHPVIVHRWLYQQLISSYFAMYIFCSVPSGGNPQKVAQEPY
ncbi:hypothetical protein SS50377_25209 [Spironucleus salmonicida]|uniref:Uncharacterized protein n=1 Tax=Spironucleus salmonicida TaxID=348837 RepID=V6LPU1_9EUKA|nr:hypothetical protein SS50377_25209 [Spironucleus salmonicida]|eukprot:EST46258.1 Hypothetical protein SS50377_13733 [Spironucleus salmonicida]